MKSMFSVDLEHSPPRLWTGNKMRFEGVADLLDSSSSDKMARIARGGQQPKPSHLQKSFELIEERLGYGTADKWLDDFSTESPDTFGYSVSIGYLLYHVDQTSRSQGLKG
jgi:hypothetical protein